MLILSRRVDESITIGDNVQITVLSVSGKQVRLGIEAPKDIDVHRGEIYTRINGKTFKLNEKPEAETSSQASS